MYIIIYIIHIYTYSICEFLDLTIIRYPTIACQGSSSVHASPDRAVSRQQNEGVLVYPEIW